MKNHLNKKFNLIISVFLMLFLIFSSASAAESDRKFEAHGKFGAVSSGHPLATKEAIKVLKNGGNAVDAAVAAAFMLGVVDFSNSGIGGDGHALIRMPSGRIIAWDASVKLPAGFSGKPGDHPLGLPTLPEMLLKLLRLYGSRSRVEILAPAISTCLKGFRISAYLEKVIERSLLKITDPATIKFLAADGFPLRAGQNFKQPVLAETLIELASDGGKSFYHGETAEKIVTDMQKHGSEYSIIDLNAYRSQPAAPFRFDSGDFTIFGNPPPAGSIATIRLIKEFLDSGINLDNPSSTEIVKLARTGKQLLDLKYDGISKCLNKPSDFFNLEIKDSKSKNEDISNTTHLCVWDASGMIISLTLTLGSHFGTGQISPAGFFYNNGLRNFSSEVGGYPKDYPHKTGPVSAKSPIIILKNNKPFLATGGAGSNRIIFNTALAAARAIQSEKSFFDINRKPRFFMDYREKLCLEWSPELDLCQIREAYKNVEIKSGCDDYFGLVSAIMASGTEILAIADHRRDGSCAALNKDPLRERSFELETIINSKKSFKKLNVAIAKETPFQHPENPIYKKPVSDAQKENGRTTLFMKSKSNSAIVSQKVKISPEPVKFKMNYFIKLENAFLKINDSSHFARFAKKYENEKNLDDLLQKLVIDIAFKIPYKKVIKRTTSEEMLEMGFGDCSGKARLLNDVLRFRGLKSRLVGGLIFKPGLKTVTHLWVELFHNGTWLPICPVNNYIGHIPSNWIVFRYDEERMSEPSAKIIFNLKEIQ